MATKEEINQAYDALMAAAVALGEKSAKTNSSSGAASFAAAAAHLAEAGAWLIAPGQPHGGSGSVSVGK